MSQAAKAVSVLKSTALEPFQACGQKQLTAVLHGDAEDGEVLLLVFGNDALSLKSDPDQDTLVVVFGPVGDTGDLDDLTGDAPWSRFIGKPFFWGWLTVNQQGYTDGALISFDGVIPEVGVNVVASSLEIVLLTRVDA